MTVEDIVELQKEKWLKKYIDAIAENLNTEGKTIAETSWKGGFDSAVAIMERMYNEEIKDWQDKLIQALNYTNSILQPKLN